MGFLFDWVGSSNKVSGEIPEIFPMPIPQKDFVAIDTQTIYQRILIDTLERTEGIPEDKQNLLWDNCVASESQDGLVTMLAKAILDKRELFIVYDAALKLIRKANQAEETQIKADYKAKGESSSGVFITFKNYVKTDMVKLYSLLEYLSVSALYKSMNLSKAIQIKINDMRASVSLSDSNDVKEQAVAIATGLREGKDVSMDGKDSVVTTTPDLTATTTALEFIAKKMSFYLGMPASYILGILQTGISDTGGADAKAIERGLKNYYFSIIKPVLEAIFGIKTSFKSDDFNALSTSLEALKTFDITSEDYMSKDNKTSVVNKLFGFPKDTKGDKPEKVVVNENVNNNVNNNFGGQP